MRVLRRIEGVSRADRVRNENVRSRLEQVGILKLARRRQEKWLDRLERMQDNRIRKFLMESLKGRDLEEGHREDGLTILKNNLSLKLDTYDHYCCLCSWMTSSIGDLYPS